MVIVPYMRRDLWYYQQQLVDNAFFLVNRRIKIENEPIVQKLKDHRKGELELTDEELKDLKAQKEPELGEQYRNLFMKILTTAQMQMDDTIKLYKDNLIYAYHDHTQSYSVKTNNKRLAKLTNPSKPPCSPTIYNRVMRLIKHGFIQGKIPHGPLRDYELQVNQKLLIWSDYRNAKTIVPEKMLRPETQASMIAQIKILNVSKHTSSNTNKSITTSHDVVNKCSSTPVSHLPGGKLKASPSGESINSYGKTKANGNISETKKVTEKKGLNHRFAERGAQKGYVGIYRNKLSDYNSRLLKRRKENARVMYSYAAAKLWRAEEFENKGNSKYGGVFGGGKQIFAEEEAKTIDYIENKYFSATTLTALDYALEHYKKRIDTAHRFLKRKEYWKRLEWNVNPGYYFDVENSAGFVKTRGWVVKSNDWEIAKRKENQRKKTYRILRSYIDKYNENPTFTNFYAQLKHIKINYPDLANDYCVSTVKKMLFQVDKDSNFNKIETLSNLEVFVTDSAYKIAHAYNSKS